MKENSILNIGISLHQMGINNWALTKEQALLVLDTLKNKMIPVLGGDIYTIVNEFPIPSYDNWFCNKNKNETISDYSERSINIAIQYIKNYQSNQKVFFVLTLLGNEGKN